MALFYVKPAQDSFMLRGRMAGCAIRDYQLEGIAEMAEDWGGGYAHVTTRGNYQIREIMPENAMKILLKLGDLGLTSKGSGADNLRNITASPTSGFDPHEVYDVLPLARDMHTYILNTREMYDLPRKFNISFDNGGPVSVCMDTNDIGFLAVKCSGRQKMCLLAFISACNCVALQDTSSLPKIADSCLRLKSASRSLPRW